MRICSIENFHLEKLSVMDWCCINVDQYVEFFYWYTKKLWQLLCDFFKSIIPSLTSQYGNDFFESQQSVKNHMLPFCLLYFRKHSNSTAEQAGGEFDRMYLVPLPT